MKREKKSDPERQLKIIQPVVTANKNSKKIILPGSTIGVFGSGQLGRMMALSGRAMGYRIHTFSPESHSPTGQIADREVVATYADLDAVRDFVRSVDVVTFEFENVAAHVAQIAEEEDVPVRPGGGVLHITQHRLREKEFFRANGLPVTPFVAIHSLAELQTSLETIGYPAILKTAAFGYDGKGQVRITSPEQVASAWQALGGQDAILESYVNYEMEISVVAARGIDGSIAHYGTIQNEHRQHILDLSISPAPIESTITTQAVELACSVLEKLNVVGVLCVEMFLTTAGKLLINELAPRPHNSGHLTIDACVTSQFEQQVRAVCGLPLGSTRQLSPAAMAQLLGDLWQKGEPNWQAALTDPAVKLHLYGKQEARNGRKMGHLTAIADSTEEAVHRVLAARDALSTPL